MSLTNLRLPSSFRDPSGFVFTWEGEILRQVNQSYAENYEFLMTSGLYEELVNAGLLITHEEIEAQGLGSAGSYKIIRPERIPFVSYPYEWCFSQLKRAALATLQIEKTALDFGMTLKDASAFNIQFIGERPVLIDLLSFERLQEGAPWVAYRQFCQHFLAPLALMGYKDVALSQLSRTFIDGIPLELAHKLLPARTMFRPGLSAHLHLHAKFQSKHSAETDIKGRRSKSFSLRAFRGLVDSLESSVSKLRWKLENTQWGDYDERGSYSAEGLGDKTRLVAGFINEVSPKTLWDLGANTGHFSRLASEVGAQTVAFDKDPTAVEKNYLNVVDRKEANILPLVLDLANPTPQIGWANQERMDIRERGPADMILALALIHHLAISDNLPLGMIASYFSELCQWAVVEFVPKIDKQVDRLLATREDVFPNYNQNGFESEFSRFFEIKASISLEESERVLYLLRKK